jgi:hypothetical protein
VLSLLLLLLAPGLLPLPLVLLCAQAADAMPTRTAVTAALMTVRFMKASSL